MEPTTPSKTLCVLTEEWGEIQRRLFTYDEPRWKAAEFLISKQSTDGAWRSDLVGTFKDGTALTPLVLLALLHAGAKSLVIWDGAKWLARMVKPDGSIMPPEKHGFDYPVYTAALT
ncbi:MAG: hypothetical protein ACJ8F7_00555, partial [Gemmataceae bacterium]